MQHVKQQWQTTQMDCRARKQAVAQAVPSLLEHPKAHLEISIQIGVAQHNACAKYNLGGIH